jgi:hypothetical protein
MSPRPQLPLRWQRVRCLEMWRDRSRQALPPRRKLPNPFHRRMPEIHPSVKGRPVLPLRPTRTPARKPRLRLRRRLALQGLRARRHSGASVRLETGPRSRRHPGEVTGPQTGSKTRRRPEPSARPGTGPRPPRQPGPPMQLEGHPIPPTTRLGTTRHSPWVGRRKWARRRKGEWTRHPPRRSPAPSLRRSRIRPGRACSLTARRTTTAAERAISRTGGKPQQACRNRSARSRAVRARPNPRTPSRRKPILWPMVEAILHQRESREELRGSQMIEVHPWRPLCPLPIAAGNPPIRT